MKTNRILLLLITMAMAVSSVSAQHHIGVRGGVGFGTARFTPHRETGWESGLMSGGISWKYYTAAPYAGGIQADLQFIERGFKYFTRVNSDTTYHRTIKSIELPFMWQPHIYMFNKKLRVFINLGVYISYNFDSDYKWVSQERGVFEEGKYDMEIVKDNIWGYGLCGGGGLSYIFNRWEVFGEVRYSFGYSDILKSGTKYPGNPQQSPMDGLNISLGLYRRLGSGEILSRQGMRKSKK